MVIYGVALTPLTETVRTTQPELLQAWYADDSSFGGTTAEIAAAMRTILEKGPTRGYYPEPSKSILICNSAVRNTVQAELQNFGFQYKTGYRHVGGYLGSTEARDAWIQPQVQQWCKGVERLAQVALRFPQTAFAGLTKSLQLEWQYLQRVVPRTGRALAPIEATIANSFLPALLAEKDETIKQLREVSTLPVRHAGLGIPDPGAIAAANYVDSHQMMDLLTMSLMNRTELGVRTYVLNCAGMRKLQHKLKEEATAAKHKRMSSAAKPADARRMARAKETGAWLTATPNTLNGTELSADEFRDNLRIRLGLIPASLPQQCVGCSNQFTVEHAMSCKKGGSCHNAITISRRSGTTSAPRHFPRPLSPTNH